MTTYQVHPIITGLNATDQGIMTYQRGYGKAIHIPIYAWYLEGGGRKILIDTGLEDFIVPEGLEKELGIKCEYLEDGLERLGVGPEEINAIIHTHLHNDHCENDALFPNAKVYAQKAEVEFMRGPHPLDHRYDADYLEGCDLEEIQGDQELFPGIKVVFTPGHTPGGQSAIVDTAHHGKVLITGFCCNEQNFPKAGPAVCPGVHTDALLAWDSVNAVKKLLHDGEIDKIIPCHSLEPAKRGVIA